MTPRGLSRQTAANYIGCSPRTFDSMVEDGRMPAAKRINTKKVWDRFELDESFEALPGDNDMGNDWDESCN
jgi:hypothetical protein